MKNNVDSAIPVLTRMNYGYWGKISEIELLSLTRWIVQFTMSYEFADRESAVIPQSVRSNFSSTNEISDNWIIAVGVATSSQWRDPVFHRGMGVMYPDGSFRPVQVTAFMFGMLFALSFYSDFPPPKPVFSAISNLHLSVIHPRLTETLVRPTWQHSEATVPVVVDIITSAFGGWVESLGDI